MWEICLSTPIKIAAIWSTHKNDPTFSTHHSFWEETIKDRTDCVFDRYTWLDFHQMPHGYDLYLFIDFHPSLYSLDTLNYHPRVFYWWDCFHQPFSFVSQVTELFDMSYFAEYQTANYLANQGYKVKWLPPAFYPKLYRPIEADNLYHYAFVGQLDTTIKRKGLTRLDFISQLARTPSINGYIGRNVFGEQVNLIYNQSRILFDRTIFNNIGTRFFETIGSGKFTLANRTKGPNGADLLAVDGVHYVSYDDTFQDFIFKLRYYLEHENERVKIQKQGAEHFLNNHTYNHRLNQILIDMHL